jgi:HTH-type transcriptional regulator/antitoxin HigA
MTTLPHELLDHWAVVGPVLAIRDEREYDLAVARLNELVDEVGDDEGHALYSLLDTFG